jgi:hypothetical protein
MSDVSEISLDKLTRAYIKIRDARAELTTAYKAKDEDLVGQMDAIKRALLDHCKEHGVDSVRTSEGMFYRTVKTRYWTSDWESMNQFIMEHMVPEFYEKRLNQTVMKQFLEENPHLMPPGLNVDSEYMVSVRKK